MTEHRDRVVDEVTEKVVQRGSTPDEEAVVRPRAEEAVDDLLEAPVQTFTPLLAENAVVTGLLAEDDGVTQDE